MTTELVQIMERIMSNIHQRMTEQITMAGNDSRRQQLIRVHLAELDDLNADFDCSLADG